jgi:SAM-dependent methyltransferase
MLPLLLALLVAQPPPPGNAVREFSEWRRQQPAPAGEFDLATAYREHLKRTGLSDAEIKTVFLDLERDRWDRAFSSPNPFFNPAPNAFLCEIVKTLRPGRALDIGMGQGRNAVHLARLGWRVTGFDISETGLAIACKSAAAAGVEIEAINASMDAFDYRVAQWDLIVATYQGAEWREKAVRGLKAGGILVVEGFLRGPQTPPGASFGPNELPRLALELNLRILRYEDVDGKPDWGLLPGRVVRLCAQKPE